MVTYQPIHCHSMYSLLDGMSKPADMAERCIEIGATSCALTDHGNIAGAIKFYSEMRKRDLSLSWAKRFTFASKMRRLKTKIMLNLVTSSCLQKTLTAGNNSSG